MLQVLTINPGSTSTKVAVFQDDVVLAETALKHSDADLAQFQGQPVVAQLPLRAGAIRQWLTDSGHAQTRWDAVCGRGGLLAPLESGTYVVDAAMLHDLKCAER